MKLFVKRILQSNQNATFCGVALFHFYAGKFCGHYSDGQSIERTFYLGIDPDKRPDILDDSNKAQKIMYNK